MENAKRDLSLDFTKPRHVRAGQPAPSLVTPILALSTPEQIRMISGEELAVLTPNGISSVIPQSNILPSPLIPTTVNCNNIINNTNYNNSNHSVNNSMNCHQNGANNNNNNNTSKNHNLHDGAQKRSDKGIRDLDSEKIEKKRERNRLAAKKCRQRKLETIDELRKTVLEKDQKNEKLEMEIERRDREIERRDGDIERYKKMLMEYDRFKIQFEQQAKELSELKRLISQ